MTKIQPVVPYGNYSVNITKQEQKFINDTFRMELSKNRQKNTTRRNDDFGYGAALTCLARDFVTATPREAALIKAKMEFLQNLINGNLQVDADINSQKNGDSCNLITTKGDSFVKKADASAGVIEKTAEGISKVTDSTSGLVSTTSKAFLDVVA